MELKIPDLPLECWELIFSSMSHRHQLSPISLVCKAFLSITNDLVETLEVSDRTAIGLPNLLRRFSKLRAINFSGFCGEIDDLLSLVANSGSAIESLDVSDRRDFPIRGLRILASKKNLKSLDCSKIALCDEDLDSIAKAFPLLEDLNISYPEKCRFSDSKRLASPVSDAGVLFLSSKLPSLRKINLSGNHFITDKSLHFLSTNCSQLTRIALNSCDFVTQNGVASVISRCTDLTSVSVNGIGHSLVDSALCDSMKNHARSLREVDLRDSVISDESLRSMESLPLIRIALANCRGFTFHGISSLLSRTSSTLRRLDLEAAEFLRDESVAELSKLLGSLTHVNLGSCKMLTESTLFSFARNCPSLTEIRMVNTSLGAAKKETAFSPGVKTRIKHLYLGQNRLLRDQGVEAMASICPQLETLDLSRCPGITEEGVSGALKICPKIRRLDMSRCGGVKSLVLESELPKLEAICASETGIDDYVLGSIGNKCSGLIELDLSGCLGVTSKGVSGIVQNCRAVREINLRLCNNVNIDSVAWMVYSRRIVSSCCSGSTQRQRSFFLRHGCLVGQG